MPCQVAYRQWLYAIRMIFASWRSLTWNVYGIRSAAFLRDSLRSTPPQSELISAAHLHISFYFVLCFFFSFFFFSFFSTYAGSYVMLRSRRSDDKV